MTQRIDYVGTVSTIRFQDVLAAIQVLLKMGFLSFFPLSHSICYVSSRVEMQHWNKIMLNPARHYCAEPSSEIQTAIYF